MKAEEKVKVGIKIPKRYASSYIDSLGFEQRTVNVLLRGFFKMGIKDPTLQDVVNNYRQVMKFAGCGPTTRKDLNSCLIEYTLIDLNVEQTLEWVLDFIALNIKGGRSQNYE